MGIVYLLMCCDDFGNELYKIGVTKRDINKRLKELNTGNPNKISLLNFYSSDNYLKIERLLHKKFSNTTLAKNEWRTLTNEEILSFQNNCKKLDEMIKFLLKENSLFK